MTKADIIHLTSKPPFTSGSYNRTIGEWLDQFNDLRQATVSYWNEALPKGVEADSRVILVNDTGLSVIQRATLLTPERIRSQWFNGVAQRQSLIYLWKAQQILAQLRPKLIICHDNYKFGAILKQQIDWPCRLVLAQHGLSYHLPAARATHLYSLKSFDAVWAMTRTSYRFDRNRMAAYEPIVHVLPNPVDTNRFHPANEAERREARLRWDLPQDKLIVLSLARLVAQKGAHVILKTWPEVLRQCPNAFLWIVGGGDADYARYLQTLIEAMKLTNSVRVQGMAQPEDTPSCYRASNVFVFPTLISEGQSFALLEALASGLPAVASHQDSMEEAFPPEILILVKDANISGQFVKPISSLLNDALRRKQMSEDTREFILRHHSKQVVLPMVERFFRHQLSLVGGVS